MLTAFSQQKTTGALAEIEKLELKCADQEQELVSLRDNIACEKEISAKMANKFGLGKKMTAP